VRGGGTSKTTVNKYSRETAWKKGQPPDLVRDTNLEMTSGFRKMGGQFTSMVKGERPEDSSPTRNQLRRKKTRKNKKTERRAQRPSLIRGRKKRTGCDHFVPKKGTGEGPGNREPLHLRRGFDCQVPGESFRKSQGLNSLWKKVSNVDLTMSIVCGENEPHQACKARYPAQAKPMRGRGGEKVLSGGK